MLRRSLVVPGLAAALSLAISPVAVSSVAAEPPEPDRVVVQTTARTALLDAERALTGRAAVPELDGGPGLTLLLRDLRAAYAGLPPADQRRADRLLARPYGGGVDATVLYDAAADPTTDCLVAPTPGSKVCVHWARATADAPDLSDGDADGVPNYVETVRDELNDVWRRVVTDGGYRAPLSDAGSVNRGVDGRLDVYLADLSPLGYYGYCTSDDPRDAVSTYAISAFCVLDDDYARTEFGDAEPMDSMRVTAAHEFFHAVQFAYDSREDRWLMEASSAWIEDELFGDIDDNRQFLTQSPLSHPGIPLDYADATHLGEYGAWIFLRYLTERFPDEGGTGLPVVVREIWERAASPSFANWGEYSLEAVVNELADRGVPFTRFFQQFGVANRRPAASYEEGKAYPAAPLADTMKVKDTRPREVRGRPYHLSNRTIRMVPGAALTAKRWRVRVRADLPPRRYGYGLAVTVLGRSGTVATKYVALDAAGNGTVKVPFSRRTVRSVELTITNASTRYNCWLDTGLSCAGVSKDDGRRGTVTLRAFR